MTERILTIAEIVQDNLRWDDMIGYACKKNAMIAALEDHELKMLAAAKAEAVASALEQVADSFIQERIKWVKEAGLASWQGTELGCSCYGTDKENSHASGCARHIAAKIRALSPIPNARALWEAEARLAEAKRWHMHHGRLMSHSINECDPCARIFKLESVVAKLREEREEK